MLEYKIDPNTKVVVVVNPGNLKEDHVHPKHTVAYSSARPPKIKRKLCLFVSTNTSTYLTVATLTFKTGYTSKECTY